MERVDVESWLNSLGGILLVIGLLVFVFDGDPDIHDITVAYLTEQVWSAED